MAGVFDDDIRTAQELIALYGADCLWFKAVEEADGGVPGYPVAGEDSDGIPCKIVFFSAKDLGYGLSLFRSLMPGTEVPMGNEMGLMAGGIAFTPEDSDTFSRAGDTFAVKGIDRLAPNGTPILYFISVQS